MIYIKTTKKLKGRIYIPFWKWGSQKFFTRPKLIYLSFLNPIKTTSTTTMDLYSQEKPLEP
jgi:hypothetical protein